MLGRALLSSCEESYCSLSDLSRGGGKIIEPSLREKAVGLPKPNCRTAFKEERLWVDLYPASITY